MIELYSHTIHPPHGSLTGFGHPGIRGAHAGGIEGLGFYEGCFKTKFPSQPLSNNLSKPTVFVLNCDICLEAIWAT